jgi:hypothetical protein
MKTAMQELIDELERVRLMTNMNFVIRIATDLLEKEKEQMLNFYMWMRMNENTEKYLDYSDEDMFKEYLNQDK